MNEMINPPLKDANVCDLDPRYLELTNAELLELVHDHDKFISLVNKLILTAEQKIEANRASEGVEYLIEAERILEYAASCGKNICRSLIMSVLHNQAYGYQRLWELNKCSNYLQALIYNINAKYSVVETPLLLTEANFDNQLPTSDSKLNIDKNNQLKMLKKLEPDEKIKLAKYHLQFSAVNSQLKNHHKASESSLYAIQIIKQLFADSRVSFKNSDSSNKEPALIKLILENICKMKEKPKTQYCGAYPKICRLVHQSWLKNAEKDNKVLASIQNYSIGMVMQIKAYTKDIKEVESTKYSNSDYIIESLDLSRYQLSYSKIIQQILLLCVAFFTLATEIRLAANCIREACSGRSQELEKKMAEAQTYHIMAIIIFYIYVPAKLEFVNHIITSYKNNFSGKLSACWGEDIFLTKEEAEILEGLDLNNVRNWKSNQEARSQIFNQVSMGESIRIKNSLNSCLESNNLNSHEQIDNVRKLEKKCRKIITEKYVDDEFPARKRHRTQLKGKNKSRSSINNQLTSSSSKIAKKKKESSKYYQDERKQIIEREKSRGDKLDPRGYYDRILNNEMDIPLVSSGYHDGSNSKSSRGQSKRGKKSGLVKKLEQLGSSRRNKDQNFDKNKKKNAKDHFRPKSKRKDGSNGSPKGIKSKSKKRDISKSRPTTAVVCRPSTARPSTARKEQGTRKNAKPTPNERNDYGF